MPWYQLEKPRLERPEIEAACARLVEECRTRLTPDPKRVLLLPPDRTRAHSGAGWITATLYRLIAPFAEVHLIPTLGQHLPHTPAENRWMFGPAVPPERIHAHDYLAGGVRRVGEIPAARVAETTRGAADWPIPVELNRLLLDGDWDWVINVGHVVPHEVLGFANHNKNYFVGLGGKETLCASHLAAAVYGIENNLGCVVTPLRACFNWAEERYLGHLPDVYLQVVLRRDEQSGELVHCGVYVGDDFETYLAAARRSARENVTRFAEPVPKVVAFMQGDEFFSTWVANKAVYRTRMAIADGGELLVLAPGLRRFGEQPPIEALIRRYGYAGTPRVLAWWRQNRDLQEFANGTAHLLHGSSEGRFTIRYAPGHLGREAIESVGYGYAPLAESLARYRPDERPEGWNTLEDGERVYLIRSPSAGLWSTADKLANRREAAG